MQYICTEKDISGHFAYERFSVWYKNANMIFFSMFRDFLIHQSTAKFSLINHNTSIAHRSFSKQCEKRASFMSIHLW